MTEIGKQILRLSTVDSTNNYAAKLISENKIANGTVILADEQVNGRGQRMTHWQSEAGMNLTTSIVLLDLPITVSEQFRITMWSALSVIDCLRNFSIEGKIKWPNDIYVGDKKVCGMLIENAVRGSKISSSVIGIGLNVNQLDFLDLIATSIRAENDQFVPVDDVLSSLISGFTKNSALLDAYEKLKENYLNLLYRRNVESLFELENGECVTGTIEHVSDSGRLEVRINAELRCFDLKEIKLLTDNRP